MSLSSCVVWRGSKRGTYDDDIREWERKLWESTGSSHAEPLHIDISEDFDAYDWDEFAAHFEDGIFSDEMKIIVMDYVNLFDDDYLVGLLKKAKEADTEFAIGMIQRADFSECVNKFLTESPRDFTIPYGSDIEEWIIGYFSRYDMRITKGALTLLVNHSGEEDNTTVVETCMALKHSWDGRDEPIRVDDIQKHITGHYGEGTFLDLKRAVVTGEVQEASHRCWTLLQAGNQPVSIVGYLIKAFRLMPRVYDLPNRDAAVELYNGRQFAGFAWEDTRRISRKRLVACISEISECEIKLKSSDPTPPDVLVLSLCMTLSSHFAASSRT